MSLFFCIMFPVVILILEHFKYFQRNKYVKFGLGVALLAFTSNHLANVTNNNFIFVEQNLIVSVLFLPAVSTLLYFYMRKIIKSNPS